jgi:hypothetical protein
MNARSESNLGLSIVNFQHRLYEITSLELDRESLKAIFYNKSMRVLHKPHLHS